METRKIDNAGRVTIPKSIRRRAKIGAGDTLKIEYSRGRIILTPLTNKTVVAFDGEITEVDHETLEKLKDILKKGE